MPSIHQQNLARILEAATPDTPLDFYRDLDLHDKKRLLELISHDIEVRVPALKRTFIGPQLQWRFDGPAIRLTLD